MAINKEQDLEEAAKQLEGCLKTLGPLKVALSTVDDVLTGKAGRRMIRDIELSKLMFKRIRSLSDSIVMRKDLDAMDPSLVKIAANISKLASDTLKALHRDEDPDTDSSCVEQTGGCVDPKDDKGIVRLSGVGKPIKRPKT